MPAWQFRSLSFYVSPNPWNTLHASLLLVNLQIHEHFDLLSGGAHVTLYPFRRHHNKNYKLRRGHDPPSQCVTGFEMLAAQHRSSQLPEMRLALCRGYSAGVARAEAPSPVGAS